MSPSSDANLAFTVLLSLGSFGASLTVIYYMLQMPSIVSNIAKTTFSLSFVQMILAFTVLLALITESKENYSSCLLSSLTITYCNISSMCIVCCIAYIHYRFIVEHDNTNVEKYIYKRWMLILSFGVPILAFLPLTTSSYEYDSEYCSTFIPFCTFRMTRWGVRWITFLYYVVEFILVLCIISFYSITLYQVYNNSTLSRGRVKLMVIYLFVSIFTWFPIYIWLRTPYNNSGGSGPAWFQSLAFHFWLSSGILYAIAFLGQYKALNDFEIWMRSTKNAEKMVSKKSINSIINSKTNDEFDDSDADIDLSDVKRFSEVIREKSHQKNGIVGVLEEDEDDASSSDSQAENVLSRLYKKYISNIFLNNNNNKISNNNTNSSKKVGTSTTSIDKSHRNSDESSFSGINPIVILNHDRESVIEL